MDVYRRSDRIRKKLLSHIHNDILDIFVQFLKPLDKWLMEKLDICAVLDNETGSMSKWNIEIYHCMMDKSGYHSYPEVNLIP